MHITGLAAVEVGSSFGFVMDSNDASVGYRCPSSLAILNSQSLRAQSGTMSSVPRSFRFFPTSARANPHHESKKTMQSMMPATSPMLTAAIPITFHSAASPGGVLGASFVTPISTVGEGPLLVDVVELVVAAMDCVLCAPEPRVELVRDALDTPVA